MRFFWGGHFEFSKSAILIFFIASSLWKIQPFYMKYCFFLHYGWFSQNLGKEAVRTFMHTTVVIFRSCPVWTTQPKHVWQLTHTWQNHRKKLESKHYFLQSTNKDIFCQGFGARLLIVEGLGQGLPFMCMKRITTNVSYKSKRFPINFISGS